MNASCECLSECLKVFGLIFSLPVFFFAYGEKLVKVHWGPTMFYLVHEFQIVKD